MPNKSKTRLLRAREVTQLAFRYDDGGREAAGFAGMTGDCVTRAIAIATGIPYCKIYEELNFLSESASVKYLRGFYAHKGLPGGVNHAYLNRIGWKYISTEANSKPLKFLCQEDLPKGNLIAIIEPLESDGPLHACCVKNHVIFDSGNTVALGPPVMRGYFIPRKKHKS